MKKFLIVFGFLVMSGGFYLAASNDYYMGALPAFIVGAGITVAGLSAKEDF